MLVEVPGGGTVAKVSVSDDCDMTDRSFLSIYVVVLVFCYLPHLLLFLQVADFGHSRPMFGTESVRESGTMLWSPPEVLAGKRSPLSDVWSLGCTAVEMYSELEPYNHHHKRDGEKMYTVLEKVKNGKLVRRQITSWRPRGAFKRLPAFFCPNPHFAYKAKTTM